MPSLAVTCSLVYASGIHFAEDIPVQLAIDDEGTFFGSKK
jgi:hypothetical protein